MIIQSSSMDTSFTYTTGIATDTSVEQDTVSFDNAASQAIPDSQATLFNTSQLYTSSATSVTLGGSPDVFEYDDEVDESGLDALDGITSLLEVAQNTVNEKRYAKKTRKNYSYYLNAAKRFAREQGRPYVFDSVNSDVPNVLRAFIASKCDPPLDSGKKPVSYKTAEAIRSAIKQYFRDEYNCLGPWTVDESTGVCKGNPVDSIPFDNYMKSLKNRDGRENTNKKQSLAMSLRELEALMEYLDKDSVIESEGKVNAYDCYPTPKEPLADCYLRLTEWLNYIEDPVNYGRPFQPEDYVFPCLDKDGRVKLDEPWSSTRVLSLLSKFTEAAGLLINKPKGRFSTHCFRRGGAQHWCMFAEDRWSLKAIKWWGGWSEDYQEGTIMRYLLDEIGIQNYRHTSFMGALTGDTPLNLTLFEEKLSQALLECEQRLLSQIPLLIVPKIAEILTQHSMMQGLLQPSSSQPRMTLSSDSPGQQRANQQAMSRQQYSSFYDRLYQQDQPLQSPASPVPESPKPPKIPLAKNWRNVLQQWYSGDPKKGLMLPLKDWAPSMRPGATGALYSQRKLIVDEYERLGCSENEMRKVHGDNLDSIAKLLESIRLQQQQRPSTRKRTADDASFDDEDDEEEEEEE
ncbi:hypothetical protein FBU30_001763 [Linnemannia zychae]|nr:hypothetical protein FBU30_001763 [Linnemannia zychae]